MLNKEKGLIVSGALSLSLHTKARNGQLLKKTFDYSINNLVQLLIDLLSRKNQAEVGFRHISKKLRRHSDKIFPALFIGMTDEEIDPYSHSPL